MSHLDPISVICRVMLLAWCLLALPVTAAGLFAVVQAGAFITFAAPFALANLAVFLLAIVPRSTGLHTSMSLLTIAGSLMSLAALTFYAIAAFVFGSVLLLLPAAASGGSDGPVEVLWGLASPLAPAGIGVSLFILFPLPMLIGLRPK